MHNDISKKSYIKAAYDILREEGADALTIRKVADRLHCNSANLYRYFSNLEELTLYASLKYLDDYIRQVVELSHSGKPILEQHLDVWSTFASHAFCHPQIYNNLFFGKYSDMLSSVIADYYELFPEETLNMNMDYIPVFLKEGDFFRRDYMMLEKCIQAGLFTETEAVLINKMSIYICKGCMKTLLDHPEKDPELIKADFLECVKAIHLTYANISRPPYE